VEERAYRYLVELGDDYPNDLSIYRRNREAYLEAIALYELIGSAGLHMLDDKKLQSALNASGVLPRSVEPEDFWDHLTKIRDKREEAKEINRG
jgi:hypothetical protein